MSSCNREGRFSASNPEGVMKGVFLSEAAGGRDRTRQRLGPFVVTKGRN